jgi:hypothetical protein
VTGRRERRCKQLLDDVKERGVYRKSKEETPDAPCGELAVEEAVDLS